MKDTGKILCRFERSILEISRAAKACICSSKDMQKENEITCWIAMDSIDPNKFIWNQLLSWQVPGIQVFRFIQSIWCAQRGAWR